MIGRQAELGAIRAAIAQARAGEGTAVLVTGEAGIGKTSLLGAARAEATGMHVAEARMAEPEAGIAYAGLSAIAASIPDAMAGISDDARGVLDGILGLGPPRMADPLAVAGAVLALLSAAATERPLCVIVDDAQWLDPETTVALMLCARRIALDPICLLAAGRSPAIEASPLMASFAPIPVAELAADQARALLDDAALDLAPQVGEAILATARGNPLALTEIPRALSAAERNGSAPLPDPLPGGPHLEALYAKRAAGLSADARTGLLILAASADEDPDRILGAMPDPAALDEARTAGLIGPEGLAFVHPLMRSGVYGAADPAARRDAHRRLAEALTDDPPARARHLAAAQVEADEQVAAELEAAGMLAMARLGTSSAVGLLARSAELSVTSEARVGRLTSAAQLAAAGGAFPTTLELLGAALAERPQGVPLARIEQLRGQARMWTGGAEEARDTFLAAAQAVSASEPELAARILLDAVWVISSMRGDIAHGQRIAREAERLAATGPEDLRVTATFVRRGQDVLAGTRPVLHIDEATRMESVPPYSPLAAWVGFVATQLIFGDRPGDAAGYNDGLAVGYRASRLDIAALIIEASAAAGLVRAGRFEEALPRLIRAGELARETGQAPQVAFTLAWRAYAGAVCGDPRTADLARQGTDIAMGVGIVSIAVFARHAGALASLAGGRFAEAADDLSDLMQVLRDKGMRNPEITPAGSDLVEALVGAGRRTEAMDLVPEVEEDAGRVGSTVPRALALRSRGLASEDDRSALDALRESVALLGTTQQRTELARSQLHYAERLATSGDHTASAAAAAEALDGFGALGAVPWRDRARALLARLGRAPDERVESSAVLSPQEMQVALLVADGLSNTEIGERLFVTRRTVEFHLTNVYRKLGLRGRTALAAEMSRRAAGAGSAR